VELELEKAQRLTTVARDALLDIRNLTVTYKAGSGTPAVNGVSLRISEGERVALVGESGSGKTTIGMAIAGFLAAADADVSADYLKVVGSDHLGLFTAMPRKVEGVTMMFQDAMTSLDPVWTVGSQLRAVIRSRQKLNRKSADEVCAQWLDKVGLTDTRRVMKARPYELSGGMRQRVMMAIALCSEPALLIADEPTSALDASFAREAMELIIELAADVGSAVLIVSHDLNLCARYVDRLAVMYKGELVEELATDRLEEATHPYTRALLACVPTLESADLECLPTLTDFGVISVGAA
jgi:peptide/nickel transport system ATP-binding protein